MKLSAINTGNLIALITTAEEIGAACPCLECTQDRRAALEALSNNTDLDEGTCTTIAVTVKPLYDYARQEPNPQAAAAIAFTLRQIGRVPGLMEAEQKSVLVALSLNAPGEGAAITPPPAEMAHELKAPLLPLFAADSLSKALAIRAAQNPTHPDASLWAEIASRLSHPEMTIMNRPGSPAPQARALGTDASNLITAAHQAALRGTVTLSADHLAMLKTLERVQKTAGENTIFAVAAPALRAAVAAYQGPEATADRKARADAFLASIVAMIPPASPAIAQA